jgi:hypothetical protein
MKAGKFTTAILFSSILFASCSKDKSISNTNPDTPIRATAAINKFNYISEWESGYSWTTSDSAGYKIYAHERNTPQLTSDIINNGAVLIWSKNFIDDNGQRITKPQLLPFHVLPALGRPAYDNFWYYMLNDSRITMKYRTNKYQYAGGDTYIPLPDTDVQFRYFLLSASDLSGAGYDQNTIRQLSYDQLADKFGVAY